MATYADFINDCRKERASLARLVASMESGQMGIGMPISLPKVNEQTEALIQSCKRSIDDLDVLIKAFDDEGPHA